MRHAVTDCVRNSRGSERKDRLASATACCTHLLPPPSTTLGPRQTGAFTFTRCRVLVQWSDFTVEWSKRRLVTGPRGQSSGVKRDWHVGPFAYHTVFRCAYPSVLAYRGCLCLYCQGACLTASSERQGILASSSKRNTPRHIGAMERKQPSKPWLPSAHLMRT